MRSSRPAVLALALAGVALGAACGDSLVDSSNAVVRDLGKPEPGGGGQVCTAGTAACGPTGQDCVADSATQCGQACTDCTVGFTQPASGHAVPACVHDASVPAAERFGSCGLACVDGFLACASGCCEAVAVAAGDAHTCAIAAGGALYCWGANASGQVARSFSSTSEPSPVQVFASGVTAVAAGSSHTCAVVDGALRCWGENGAGQAPDTVAGVAGATALAAGQSHTCARLSSGAVRCWGAAARIAGGTPVSSGAAGVSAGRDHTCALLSSGAVLCWGDGSLGQLGVATVTQTVETPIASGITALAAGRNHTCAALAAPTEVSGISDAVKCFGAAPGPTFMPADPQRVPAIPMKNAGQSTIRFDVNRVGAGRTHTCVQRAPTGLPAESIKCFGPDNGLGQLGNFPTGPTEAADVGGTGAARGFAVGADHGCAIFADGSVHCWGDNRSGQLGDGTITTPGIGTVVAVRGR